MIVASLGAPALAQDAPLPPSPSGAVPAPAPAEPAPVPATPGPDLAALQTRLGVLEQRTQALEAERTRLLSQPAPAPRPAAATVTADESGFALTSADRQYQFRLKAQLQVDGRRFFNDWIIEANDTFLVRRARPIIAGTLFGLTDFYLAPDFGNNTVALYDAYLDTHPWPWLRLRVGKFKGPVGLERLQSDSDLVVVERALDANLSSQREVGIQLWGDVAGGVVHWDLGIFNGNPDNGLNDIDSNHAKSFAGRLFVQPFALEPLRIAGRLGIGIAASTGNEKGSATAPWLNPFKSPGQQTIFSYLASTPANTVFAQGRHTRINPQLYYYIGPFGLLAEWVKEYQELANSIGTGAVNNNAAHATASVVIGGAASYEGIKPTHPLSVANGTFGAVEVALRYEYLKIDTDAFPTAADPSKSISRARSGGVALNWQLTRNIKASADFIQSWFDGGAPNKGNRATEKVGLARFQVYF